MFSRSSFILIFWFMFSFTQKLVDANLSPRDGMAETRLRRSVKTAGTSSNECFQPACKEAASELLVTMNHHADSCEEFQDLSCGNKIQENGFNMENFKVLNDYIRMEINNTSEKFLHDFRSFYDSCVGYNSNFDFLQKLDFVTNSSAADITEVFVESILTQSMLFFDVGIDIAEENESYQFLITLPGESILKTHTKGWSILEESQKECQEILHSSVVYKRMDLDVMYAAYAKCKQEMLFKYAEDFESVMKLTDRMMNNEGHLRDLLQLYQTYQLSPEMIQNTKMSNIITKMTIDEINQQYGIINWKLFFEKITTNKTFVGNEMVLVAFPAYFQNIFKELGNYETSKLTKMIQELTSLHLYRHLLHHRTTTKKLYCMDLANQLMPDVVSWILYDLSPSKKTHLSIFQTRAIFKNLKQILIKSFQDSSLDDMTKEKFIKKLNRLQLGLITAGDTNTTRDNYKMIKVRTDFQQNLLNLLRNNRRYLYSFVGSKSSPATLLNFFVSGFHAKPTTYYTSDSIVLHPEIYNKVPSTLPEHVRLAKLGFFLAKAIAKHFDTKGRLYMTDGITSNEYYYEDLITRTAEVFETYYTKTPYMFHKTILVFKPVSGKRFANEMISDNAALRLTTDSLGKVTKPKELPWVVNGSITLNQTFFIAVAQEFCDDQSEANFMIDLLEKGNLPYHIKIRNIMSNSEIFSETFSCKEGSALWLDRSIIRQFPQSPDEYEDFGQLEGQYDT